jgi:putative acetyltransferase
MEIQIRNEETRDVDAVREILRATFPTDAESRLVDALRANGKAIISLVAVSGDEVVGHILFSEVTTAPPNEAKGIGLAPVAVRPDMQSRRIGSRLIHHGLRLCNQLEYDYCVVLGSPEYYGRFGFEKASNFGMQNEYGVDDEFMLIDFGRRAVPTGVLKYAPEFALFSA